MYLARALISLIFKFGLGSLSRIDTCKLHKPCTFRAWYGWSCRMLDLTNLYMLLFVVKCGAIATMDVTSCGESKLACLWPQWLGPESELARALCGWVGAINHYNSSIMSTLLVGNSVHENFLSVMWCHFIIISPIHDPCLSAC